MNCYLNAYVKVVRYNNDTIRQLLKAVHDNPYDNTLHGAVADALDEHSPNNIISDLIRQHIGAGQYSEPQRQNLWWELASNHGITPYMGYSLGNHGPFKLWLRHEGGPEQAQRWAIHANSIYPETNKLNYTFEFPHSEAHIISKTFPTASHFIDPHNPVENNAGDASLVAAENAFRNSEANRFTQEMRQLENERRNRGE